MLTVLGQYACGLLQAFHSFHSSCINLLIYCNTRGDEQQLETLEQLGGVEEQLQGLREED